jgi:hypothetical protein
MPKALEMITGRATAPGATLTALTMSAGDTLTVRNAPLESMVRLLQCWADNQAAGTLRIRSPRMHDNVEGIRLGIVASEVKPLLPDRVVQPLIPQDTLVAQISGSAVAGDIESAAILLFYENLPGVSARLIDVPTLLANTVHVMAVENTLALGTGGGYSGEEALTAEFDQLKANTDYALVGYEVSAECLSVGWRGSDTGNLRVGGPGDELGRDITCSWFYNLALAYQMPLIPVFNSANKDAILIDGVQDENGADVTVTSILYQLKPGAVPPGG